MTPASSPSEPGASRAASERLGAWTVELAELETPALRGSVRANRGSARSSAASAGPSGHLQVARYRVGPLPVTVRLDGLRERVTIVADRCDDSLGVGPTGCSRWHLLFAGVHAFRPSRPRTQENGSQSQALLRAHPMLVHLDRWLAGAGLATTVEDAGVATPYLVQGVPLARDPSRTSNILAVAAPPTGHGPYWEEEIRHALRTASGAWAAAIAESGGRPVELHGGFWGCGRLGGNRELMVAMQALATLIAGADRLVLHTIDREGEEIARRAIDDTAFLLARLAPRTNHGIPMIHLIDALLDRGYRWAVPTPASPVAAGLRRSA